MCGNGILLVEGREGKVGGKVLSSMYVCDMYCEGFYFL